MTFPIPETFDNYDIYEGINDGNNLTYSIYNMATLGRLDGVISQNNLSLCQADYYEACWCRLNTNETIICPYLLRHARSFSNTSYYCVYHVIRKSIECFDSHYIFPKHLESDIQIYLTLILFLIGLIGNGISIIILVSTKLRNLSIYRNLTILCLLNIFYLLSILIRDLNLFKNDLRNLSINFCRFHVFLTAFFGHLCSWQLVSTSIQRVYALLSLQSHRTMSWIRTWSIFFVGIAIPLFIFDGQLLFDYGIFRDNHICKEILTHDIRQLRRAADFPIDIFQFSTKIPVKYFTSWIPGPTERNQKGYICLLWNVSDTTIYVLIPFVITLLCSLVIIIKVCQRRRSTVVLGGICHLNREIMVSPQDHLSTVLISTNILYFVMIGPFNICLMIQSAYDCVSLEPSPSTIETFENVIEYLRLFQNAYHALSFVFYCVIGNKFRSSAKSICRTIYSKLIDFGLADRCAETPLISCCLDRRRSSSSGPTASTNSRLSDNRRLTVDLSHPIPLSVLRRPTYVTFDPNQNTTLVCKCVKV